MWILILTLISIGLFYFYKYSVKHYDYFLKPNQQIKFIKPLPLLGSNFGMFFKKQPFIKMLEEEYKFYENEKMIGMFAFRQPVVLLRDPKIAKQLLIREFEHFTDHASQFDGADPLLEKSLIALNGQKWKDMRSTLSPAFTGSKMRLMYNFIVEITDKSIKSMAEGIKKSGNIDFEFQELTTKFTVDVIASCAFGIEVNSFDDPKNSFFEMAAKITNTTTDWKQILKFFGFMISPKVMKMLNFDLFDSNLNYLIRDLTMNTMRVREEKKIVRHDMINLLMQAKKGQLETNNNIDEKITEGFATAKEFTASNSSSSHNSGSLRAVWDDDDLAAQCLIFFLGGFSTVSQTLSFMAYEITCNPDIQQKLYDEILEMENELNGAKLSYEKIQGMKYLDQVICETLRHWPILALTERICGKDLDFVMDDGQIFHFDKGVNVNIPVYQFHHDPKYYKNPEKFDPERFNDENRKSIDPDTFIPFGIGPRNCVGSRFALMEMKTILYYLLLSFSFEVIEKTQIPFKYEDTIFAQKPANGFWIGLKPRQQRK